jgi:carbohydrate-binding DOMON domain-containing protein
MHRKNWLRAAALGLAGGLLVAAAAGAVTFKDPAGDDNGPGNYTYPTDGVYKPGSFDIVAFSAEAKGDKVDFEVTTNSTLEDPWGMKVGFAVQMLFVFIDCDHQEGSGFTDAPPGLNVKLAPADAWDRLVVLSPQGPGRVRTEVEQKAAAMKEAIAVPTRTRGSGRSISASVDKGALCEGDPETWGYQVVMQSNEGFPAGNDLLTRKVNEYEGQHRFGGGNDGDCDPHTMDILAGAASGDASETQAQHDMLRYECNPDGTAKTMATLTMVRKAG